MSRLFHRRVLTVFAVLSLVSTLAALTCPTCEVALHGLWPVGGGDVATRFADDWGVNDAACACCEADTCAETDDLPTGRVRRVVLTAPALLAATAVDLPPPRVSDPTGPRPQTVYPPEQTRLHLRNASLRC